MTEEGRLKEELNTGSMVTDHAFYPRKKEEPWGLCECGLGEAAHAETRLPYRPGSLRAAREAPRNDGQYYNNGSVTQEVRNVFAELDGDAD